VRENICSYYCKVCEAYSLCLNCYVEKRRAEDSEKKGRGQNKVIVKGTQGGLERGEEATKKGT
jgi:hypothetical protein